MKRLKILPFLLFALLVTPLMAQTYDSVDVQDYDITLDLSQGKPFAGETMLTVRLTRLCDSISLSLCGVVDSLWVNEVAVENPVLSAIPTTGIVVGEDFTIRVCYHGSGYVESGGWGGFHFDNDMSYNLGVGFKTDPHVMGRAFFPCRDNFTDKATYTFRVKTCVGWTAECGGMLQSRVAHADGTEESVWRLDLPTPTYLVSVSQAAWKRIQDSIPSVYGVYPVTYGYLSPDSTTVRQVFAELDSVVPMYERCFGPYRWGRIGYIATNKGSMEHVNNIGLAKQAMNAISDFGQSNIAHELGHAWFGNLVTCATEEDMWINEGGASFTSEVAMQSVSGRGASDKYYQKGLEEVIRATHFTDNGYRPLSPMPHNYTYGSTVYDKGWLVWHSLRGYLGEETFYAAVRRLMSSCAFGNIDSYQLRDSLSLYTGVDLTDFFNFYVFTPGFVDYHVDAEYNGRQAVVTLRQQGVGTDVAVHSNRVPVTFFSHSGEQYKHWFAFAGEDTTLTIELPFDNPAYHVLDYDLEISDAATVGKFAVRNSGTETVKWAHVRLSYEQESPVNVPVVIEHHWGHPWDVDATNGVLRVTDRYWVVHSPESYLTSVTGLFHYVRGGYGGGDYSYLDGNFYMQQSSIDSVRVLYREDREHPWVSVSYDRTGNNNEGYLAVQNLRTGEYTLAVVDTNLVGVAEVDREHTSLFPNPIRQGEALTVEGPAEDLYSLTIVDASGRKVWSKRGLRGTVVVNPQLMPGTYLVHIENKFVSLQSKLIVL